MQSRLRTAQEIKEQEHHLLHTMPAFFLHRTLMELDSKTALQKFSYTKFWTEKTRKGLKQLTQTSGGLREPPSPRLISQGVICLFFFYLEAETNAFTQ